MRRAVLWSSVRRQLDIDEELLDVAYMWHRHRLALPFAALAAVVLGAIAFVAGFGTPASVGIGLAGFAVAGSAATDYRVLAVTDRDLVAMKGSRIRQIARPPLDRLPVDTRVERLSNNLVISEWRIGDDTYSVLRSHQATMAAIAARSRP